MIDLSQVEKHHVMCIIVVAGMICWAAILIVPEICSMLIARETLRIKDKDGREEPGTHGS